MNSEDHIKSEIARVSKVLKSQILTFTFYFDYNFVDIYQVIYVIIALITC